MAITTIIFDIGRVLNGYGWEKYLRSVVPEQKAYESVERAVFLNPVWEEHDLGLLTEEEEIQDFVAAAPEYEKEIRAVYENLGECTWSLDYAVPWVRELKEKGYGIYLCSNASLRMLSCYRQVIPAIELFDGVLFSAEVKCLKPQKEIYMHFYRRFNLKPEECFFIDDLPGNIEGARQTGMDGYCFADGDVERLKARLLSFV